MYCSYRTYRKRIKKQSKILKTLTAIFVVGVIFAYYKIFICQTIINYSLNEINSVVTASVNQAALESLSDGVKYSDLVHVEKDGNGNITLLETNAYKTNVINKEIACNTQAVIEKQCKKGVRIPLGAFTGLGLISGVGKCVKLNMLDSKSVNCRFVSHFESTGINQTRHAVYVEVNAVVKIVLPASMKEVSVTNEVMICDAVIVGKIPEVYLGNRLFN